jgi:hypothetical protein
MTAKELWIVSQNETTFDNHDSVALWIDVPQKQLKKDSPRTQKPDSLSEIFIPTLLYFQLPIRSAHCYQLIN